MDRGKAILGEVICLVAGLILCGLCGLFEVEFLLWLAIAAMLGSFVFSFFNRCPCCGHWLGRHHLFIQYCPYCGRIL